MKYAASAIWAIIGWLTWANKFSQITPIILINLNLPPDQRYKNENILTSTIIPGPRKPKDINSFLRPLVDELEVLGQTGVTAFDGEAQETFKLKAHALIVTGDGPAAADAMGMKSPGNAYRPCRSCEITGQRRQDTARSPYYVPHTDFSFENPPMRVDLRSLIEQVHQAGDTESGLLTGIRCRSELLRLSSIHFPRSFPGDIMHCVLQNVTPTLFQLWNRTKLSVDDKKNQTTTNERPSYFLTKDDMEAIGNAMSSARSTIPLSLGHAPRRIDNHYKGFKAAEWKAWLIHYGSPLLWKHLDEIYLANFRILSTFYQLATQHTVSPGQVRTIAELARSFVETFEDIYYRGIEDRLPVCTINVHSILHFAEWIRDCGPACYFWQFPMERFCGIIKPKARSKSRVNESIFNSMILTEHLNHIRFVHEGFEDLYEKQETETDRPQFSGRLRITLTVPQIRRLHFEAQMAEIQDYNVYTSCKIRSGLKVGSHYSQRQIDCNRDDHRVAYIVGRQRRFGVIQFFVHLPGSQSNTSWALITKLVGEIVFPNERVVAVQQEQGMEWIRVEQIETQIGILHEGNSRFFMIIADVDLLQ
jgi:hypothetical protein